MKKYVIYSIFGLSAIAVFLGFTAFKPSEKAEKAQPQVTNAVNPYILIEIYEIPKFKASGVHIHLGNGKTDYRPFRGFDDGANHDDNGEITLKAINELQAQGYEIVSSSGGLYHGGMITKLWMQKK